MAPPSRSGLAVPEADAPLIYLSTHYIQAKEYLDAIVASTDDAICTTDMRGRIIFFNPGAERMFGKPAREAVGLAVSSFYQGGRDEARRIMRLLVRQDRISNYETVLAISGKKIHVSMSAALMRDRHGKCLGTLGISKDITKRVHLEERLRAMSITDNLTGLFNQRHFRERASAEVQRARRQRDRLSLILIDMDHFKDINDTIGHIEGDRVLCHIGRAVNDSIRAGVDAGFRYGGDEFIVLLPGLGRWKAEIVARRIQAAFAELLKGVAADFSFGISSLRPHESADDLLQRADVRMYLHKREKNSSKIL